MLTLSEGWDSSGRGLRCLLLSESGIAFVVTCSKRSVQGRSRICHDVGAARSAREDAVT